MARQDFHIVDPTKNSYPFSLMPPQGSEKAEGRVYFEIKNGTLKYTNYMKIRKIEKCILAPMPQLEENELYKLKAGAIYISSDGNCIFKDPLVDIKIYRDSLKNIDCTNLNTKINDPEFTKQVLATLSTAGHTFVNGGMLYRIHEGELTNADLSLTETEYAALVATPLSIDNLNKHREKILNVTLLRNHTQQYIPGSYDVYSFLSPSHITEGSNDYKQFTRLEVSAIREKIVTELGKNTIAIDDLFAADLLKKDVVSYKQIQLQSMRALLFELIFEYPIINNHSFYEYLTQWVAEKMNEENPVGEPWLRMDEKIGGIWLANPEECVQKLGLLGLNIGKDSELYNVFKDSILHSFFRKNHAKYASFIDDRLDKTYTIFKQFAGFMTVAIILFQTQRPVVAYTAKNSPIMSQSIFAGTADAKFQEYCSLVSLKNMPYSEDDDAGDYADIDTAVTTPFLEQFYAAKQQKENVEVERITMTVGFLLDTVTINSHYALMGNTDFSGEVTNKFRSNSNTMERCVALMREKANKVYCRVLERSMQRQSPRLHLGVDVALEYNQQVKAEISIFEPNDPEPMALANTAPAAVVPSASEEEIIPVTKAEETREEKATKHDDQEPTAPANTIPVAAVTAAPIVAISTQERKKRTITHTVATYTNDVLKSDKPTATENHDKPQPTADALASSAATPNGQPSYSANQSMLMPPPKSIAPLYPSLALVLPESTSLASRMNPFLDKLLGYIASQSKKTEGNDRLKYLAATDLRDSITDCLKNGDRLAALHADVMEKVNNPINRQTIFKGFFASNLKKLFEECLELLSTILSEQTELTDHHGNSVPTSKK